MIEPPKAARGHATSNSANLDSIHVVQSVTKNRDPRAACKVLHVHVRPPMVEVLIFYTLRKCMNIQALMCAPLMRFSISLSDLLQVTNRLVTCGLGS